VKLDPTIINHFIIYLAIFRVGVIAAGVIAIWLGYRLFRPGLGAGAKTENGDASLEATVAGNTLALKGAAPGTFLSLFGVAIIVAMIVTGSPSMTLGPIEDAAGVTTSDSTAVGGASGVSPAVLHLRSTQMSVLAGIDRDLREGARDTATAYLDLRELVQSIQEEDSP
jgi:hypothetical protein